MGKRNWASWALAPLHLAALATGAKSFRDNPIIGSPTLNRMGLHVARIRLAHAMADRRRRRLRRLVSDEDAAAFDRDGFVIKRDFLPAEVFQQLQDQVLAFRGPARDMLQGDAVTRRIPLDAATLSQTPAARALLNDPRWLGLIRYVASSRLTPVSYIQTIFSRVRDAEPDPQTHLHADTFHPTVKAWLFLGDVTEEDGPFVYVPGSHRMSARRLDWARARSIEARDSDFLSSRGSFRITLAELTEIGLPPPRSCAVPANTLVVADTGGFHARGRSAGSGARTEIWAYGRRNPFLAWTGWSVLGWPWVRERFAPMVWGITDARERMGFKPNPWRAAGMVGLRGRPNVPDSDIPVILRSKRPL